MDNSAYTRHTFEVNEDIIQRGKVASDQWNLKPKKVSNWFLNMIPYLPRNQHLIDCFPVFQRHLQDWFAGSVGNT